MNETDLTAETQKVAELISREFSQLVKVLGNRFSVCRYLSFLVLSSLLLQAYISNLVSASTSASASM